MKKSVKGTMKYQDLEMGFWSIIGNNGEKLRPINTPEQLKNEGMKVECTYRLSDAMSIAMWGEAIEIIGFTTG